MSNEKFNEIIKALTMALLDDFRGFLIEGTKRLEVKDNEFHAVVAKQEMEKDPNYKYVSGIAQDPILDLLKAKDAIYITKIENAKNPGEYYRIVGYLKDNYKNIADFKGVTKEEYLILQDIALRMGYAVDEYSLTSKENEFPNRASVNQKTAELKVRQTPKMEMNHSRSLAEGDQPVYDSFGYLLGFKSNGKFVSVKSYERYHNLKHNRHESQNHDER